MSKDRGFHLVNRMTFESSPENQPKEIEAQEEEFTILPSKKSEEIAEGFNFFGWKPKAETIEKIREPLREYIQKPGAEFASQMFGATGGLLELAHDFMGKGKTPGWMPTPGNLKKLAQEFAGEDLEPTTAGGRLVNEIAGFGGAIMGLGGTLKAPTMAKTLQKNFLSSFVPGAVSWASKEADANPETQLALTVASSFLTHRLNQPSLKSTEKSLFEVADNLAKGKYIDVRPQADKLRGFKDQLSRRLETSPSRQFLDKHIDAILKKFDRNAITVDEWQEIRTSLNELAPEARQLKGGKQLLGHVKSIVEESIQHFEKTNPEWAKSFRAANSIHKGLHEARWAERMIKRNASLAAKSINFLPLLKMATGIGGLGAKAASSAVALARNPGYRRAYFNVLKESVKGNAKSMSKALDKFNEEKEKVDKKNQ